MTTFDKNPNPPAVEDEDTLTAEEIAECKAVGMPDWDDNVPGRTTRGRAS